MKKTLLLSSLILGLSVIGLSSCGESANTISICASELPHAKILNECVKGILKEKGFNLKVTVLDWTIQNDAVANNDYDANYFQHIPYLETYIGSTKLVPACKVHYEKLCLYASSTSHKTLTNGDSIEIVNDPSNILRALQLLESHNILSINESNYDTNGDFVNFSITNPTSCVTFKTGYENCTLKCIVEKNLCASLPDYNFGVIPGNTALTGLGTSYAERIVLAENASTEMVSLKANIIAVKESNKDSDKTKALVNACEDTRVKTYIESTFGSSVLYAFENCL